MTARRETGALTALSRKLLASVKQGILPLRREHAQQESYPIDPMREAGRREGTECR